MAHKAAPTRRKMDSAVFNQELFRKQYFGHLIWYPVYFNGGKSKLCHQVELTGKEVSPQRLPYDLPVYSCRTRDYRTQHETAFWGLKSVPGDCGKLSTTFARMPNRISSWFLVKQGTLISSSRPTDPAYFVRQFLPYNIFFFLLKQLRCSTLPFRGVTGSKIAVHSDEKQLCFVLYALKNGSLSREVG